MIFERKSVPGDVNILANDHYVGKPITLDFTGVSDGVVKAGAPISAAGVSANTADAVGILLADVYAERPIGTIVIHGFIDAAKAKDNSGVTIDAAVKAALPMVAFL
jgi:hypothetical protein|nr:MAG TPA: hypothetical protein [Caudoviricetes sp.]